MKSGGGSSAVLASAPKGEVRENEDEGTLRPVYIRGQKRHMALTETAEGPPATTWVPGPSRLAGVSVDM